MAKVYVVTSGCYSDYGINGIFSTRELAQEWIDKAANVAAMKDDEGCNLWIYGGEADAKIEEWELDALQYARIFKKWHFGMFLDDGSLENDVHEGQEFGVPHKGTATIAERVPAYDGRPCVRVESCKSAEHAKKLAVEARQKWLREKGLSHAARSRR
jgi:hypothetical protein